MAGKYGIIVSQRKKFHPGEPIVLFRSTDPITPEIVLVYIEMAKQQGCSQEFIDSLMSLRDDVIMWQIGNPELVKKVPT